jgi:hypothetical protein
MTYWVLISLWAVGFFHGMFANTRQDLSRFDLKRCYAPVSTSIWEGDPDYRQPATRNNSRSQLVCWFKDDHCFMVSNGAMCWRAAKLSKG